MILIFGVGTLYSSDVLKNIYDTLTSFETNAKKAARLQYSVLINGVYDTENGDVVPNIFGLADKKFAILEIGNTAYNHEVVALIREDIGKRVEFDSIESIDEAAEKLNSGEIDCLVINESVRSIVDYDLDELTTVVKTYEFEEEKEIIDNPAKVTKESFVVYISGVDTYGALESSSRTDVNKLAVINPLTKDILLIDIPRDYYVPQPCQNWQKDKLTHSGLYGVSCTVESISNFLDIDINYYARINFSTFVEIIEAIGGVDVQIDEGFCASDDAGGICYDTGINHLNGWDALCFARERQTLPGGDNDRIKNQSKLLRAIVNKVADPSILNNYPELLKILSKNIETNMTASDMTSLIQMQLSDMASWNIESFALDAEGMFAFSPTFGQELYMALPDNDNVFEAQKLMSEIMEKKY